MARSFSPVQVAASTQNQALSALLFLYREVLQQQIGWLDHVERSKKFARLPVVLTRAEVRQIFSHLYGTTQLMAGLLYWRRAAFDGVCSPPSERCRP